MSEYNLKRIELLSPAGDLNCLKAAVNAGADAIYCAGSRFGARAYAQNFSEDELIKAIDYVHLNEKKLYLTINTVLKNDEMKMLYEYVKPYYEAGLDGVIVQDIGVIKFVKEYFGDMPIHASTQMSITDSYGVELLKKLSVERVVLARELSLKEIHRIYKETGIDIECFIHGALCYSYSGKCLFSSMVGERSGNRGRCAQPCRLPYNDRYILSAKDICTLDFLPELIKAGIMSFKIEGRMKNPEYVAGVTGIYRKYIDILKHNPTLDYKVIKSDMNDLIDLYTRSGNSKGYYYERNGQNMISITKPCYSTAGEEEKKRLFEKYGSNNKRIKVDGYFCAIVDNEVTFSLNYKDISVTVSGQIVQRASKHPMTDEEVKQRLSKLGNTMFEYNSLECYLDEASFLPIAAINDVKREAFNKLTDEIINKYKRKACDYFTLDENTVANMFTKPKLHCMVDSLNYLDLILKYDDVNIVSISHKCLISRAEELNINYYEYYKELASTIHEKGKELFISFPIICREEFFKRYSFYSDILNDNIIDGCIVDNYEELFFVNSTSFKGLVIADLHMYAVNNIGYNTLVDNGVTITTIPVELNKKELIQRNIKNEDYIIYGRIPMMVSAQCVEKTLNRCVKDNGLTNITDRKGNVMSCIRDCNECYNVILNSVPNMVTKEKELLSELEPYSYRIKFDVENESEIKEIINFYVSLTNGNEIIPPEIKYTKGHLNRGVE